MDEIKTLIQLKHPDPVFDIDGFINSLPDDFVDGYTYRYKNYTTEEKRSKLVGFLKYSILYRHEAPDIIQQFMDRLYEYYTK